MLNRQVNRGNRKIPESLPGIRRLPWAALLAVVWFVGCNAHTERVSRAYTSPYPPAFNLAVVPFLNQSGSANLDVMTVTDEFYTELQQVSGQLHVIPVNRVLAALNDLNLNNASSPDEAMLLAEHLGVDGVIVGTVTRYDPYRPPEMGMALQMYLREMTDRSQPNTGVNPGEMARQGTVLEMPGGVPLRPQAMAVRIIDSARQEVVDRIEKYARSRGAEQTPSGWQKYLTSRNFVRFVCHEMIGELLAQEHRRLSNLKIAAAVLDDPSAGPGEL